MIQKINARSQDLNSAAQQYPIELSSCHNYTDGVTYHYVHYNDIELGRYWKHPWFDGWLFVSFGIGDGIQQETDTDYEAIALITRSWEEVLCAG